MLPPKLKGLAVLLILFYISLSGPALEPSCEHYLSIEHLSERMQQVLLADFVVTEQVNGVEVIADRKRQVLSAIYNDCLYTLIEQQLTNPSLNSTHAHLLFLLLSDLHFYTNDLAVLHQLQRIIQHAAIEPIQKRQYLDILYKRLVAVWMLSEATELVELHELDTKVVLPALAGDINNPRSLLVFDEHNKLRLSSWYRPKQPYVVVITDPRCHPSKRFLSWLQHEPKIYSLFEQQSVWLISQVGSIQQHAIEEHNQIHPKLILNYVYAEAAWPEIPLWATPTLYFFDAQGKLRYQLIGWPTEGRENELETALKLIGIHFNDTE